MISVETCEGVCTDAECPSPPCCILGQGWGASEHVLSYHELVALLCQPAILAELLEGNGELCVEVWSLVVSILGHYGISKYIKNL